MVLSEALIKSPAMKMEVESRKWSKINWTAVKYPQQKSQYDIMQNTSMDLQSQHSFSNPFNSE